MVKKYAKEFTLSELMTIAVAREIKDGEIVIIGTGLPLLAASMAERTHAPHIVMCYEAGAIDAKPRRTPLSVGDPCTIPGAALTGTLVDTLGMVHAGDIDVGFLGGAQIDKYGNLNSTCIGDYYHPKVRLPGSGGANDIASCCRRTIIVMRHEKARFVEKVDYITSPGYLTGGDARKRVGIPGSGPSVVVSTMAVLRFEPDTKEMYLDTYHPGTTIEEVKENTGWNLKVSPYVRETELPTVEEVRLLREELDPERVFLGPLTEGLIKVS